MLALLVVAFAGCVLAELWPQGVVHYAINKKDYDVHSQDIIKETLAQVQQEICVKFFNTPGEYTAGPNSKILYINNPQKLKDCPPHQFSYRGNVVDMPIGYRCVDSKNISRIVVDMLRASIEQSGASVNSYDLMQKFYARDHSISRSSLLSAADRQYVNKHYRYECGELGRAKPSRRSGNSSDEELEGELPNQLTAANEAYYKDLRWPLGVVLYGYDPDVIPPTHPPLLAVQRAMASIELHSCVVFQLLPRADVLEAHGFLWLGAEGEDLPELGFRRGNQSLNLSSLSSGAPGHAAHALAALLRALAAPAASNRHDRDSYLTVHWDRVRPGAEQYLERSPEAAWLRPLAYDPRSATHAPANYMCRDCADPVRSLTVVPVQDHLWQKTLSMGHTTELSETDKKALDLLYGNECHKRYMQEA